MNRNGAVARPLYALLTIRASFLVWFGMKSSRGLSIRLGLKHFLQDLIASTHHGLFKLIDMIFCRLLPVYVVVVISCVLPMERSAFFCDSVITLLNSAC